MGVDEDAAGLYFVRIDPATGNGTAKTSLPGASLSSGGTAVDRERGIVYHVAGPRRAPFDNFTLIAFDAASGAVRSASRLHPTPSTQGPAGLLFEPRSGLILGFMPPPGGAWHKGAALEAAIRGECHRWVDAPAD